EITKIGGAPTSLAQILSASKARARRKGAVQALISLQARRGGGNSAAPEPKRSPAALLVMVSRKV
ncbi:MAG: hypothetical protein COX15_01805, partial [Candidatus Colwellbacteria bacterium CG23_combo_of_CG06-09_8_20_14_all_42_19]